MSRNLNRCDFIGNLGKDPEQRFTPEGKAVTTFSVAVTNGKKGYEQTEWVKCVAWDRLAETCVEYLNKGSKVYVSGRLQTRSWDDKASGQKRYMTEIVLNEMQMLSSKPRAADDAGSGDYVAPRDENDDSDLPF